MVGSCFPHFDEEDCLRGWNGSGTIFFSHCNLRCVFCQNYDISQAIRPGNAAAPSSTPREIAALMLEWIAAGLGRDTYVNLMDQYHPAGRVAATSYTEINRRLSRDEYREAQRIACELGLRRLDERKPHPRLVARRRVLA